MARIPDDELERLKQSIALERLAEARGIKLKRHGSESKKQRKAKDTQILLARLAARKVIPAMSSFR